MDMMKLKIKEEADEDNHFAHIPEELLLSILSRMDDLKFLCQCSLVSKHFASTIFSIKTVSLSLPSIEIHSTKSVDNIDELFCKMLGLTSEEITRFIESSSIQELKFFLFLQNFKKLKSIYLEFMHPRSLGSSSLLEWKAKFSFSSSGAMVERLVSLVATSMSKKTEQEYGEEQEDQGTRSRFSVAHIKNGTFLPLDYCTEWLLVLCLLIKCQPSLESVIITNSEKQEKLVLRDEQLVAWRNNLLSGELLNNFTMRTCGMGWLRELHLPVSGYRMKGVYFAIMEMGVPSDSDSSTVYDDAMTWEYVGEEKLLGEALREISRKYRDPFMLRPPYPFNDPR